MELLTCHNPVDNNIISGLLITKIARRTTGGKGCYFLTGFLQEVSKNTFRKSHPSLKEDSGKSRYKSKKSLKSI